MHFNSNDTSMLNELEGFLSIKPTWLFKQFINRPERFICLYTGNQFGKSISVAKSYVMRILGIHPVESKNMRPDKKVRVYRFASENLPNESEGGEVRNTQYPAFKSVLPPSLIKRDISIRKPSMTLIDPQGGPDIIIEFVSFNQDVQAMAGVQRASCWIDESCSRTFFSEQLPRLLAADGDMIHSLTPALDGITWEYEDMFEKASTIIRTPAVCRRLKSRFKQSVESTTTTDSKEDICVLMAATDDNPAYDDLVARRNAKLNESLTKDEYISELLGTSDEETIDVRRYGIFRQVSGRIFKDFETKIHVINNDEWFPEGISDAWLHVRAIDYHPHVPWHVAFVTMSPTDEVFVYDELVASPEHYVTLDIAGMIAKHSGDNRYKLNLIDPLAAENQTNTGVSPLEDLNRIFWEFGRNGICTGGYWTTWDTKSIRGREEIRKRLVNSRLCGKPFNNRLERGGRVQNLPTIWISNRCRNTIDSMKNWRLEESSLLYLETHDMKEKPQQKWSHMMTALEAIFKHPAFKARGVDYYKTIRERSTAMAYF